MTQSINERDFYERHIPKMVKQLERIADALERQNAIFDEVSEVEIDKDK